MLRLFCLPQVWGLHRSQTVFAFLLLSIMAAIRADLDRVTWRAFAEGEQCSHFHILHLLPSTKRPAASAPLRRLLDALVDKKLLSLKPIRGGKAYQPRMANDGELCDAISSVELPDEPWDNPNLLPAPAPERDQPRVSRQPADKKPARLSAGSGSDVHQHRKPRVGPHLSDSPLTTFTSARSSFCAGLWSSEGGDFSWQWCSGPGAIPNPETGPARGPGEREYAYIDPHGRGKGQQSYLTSSDDDPFQYEKITFKYHMYGRQVPLTLFLRVAALPCLRGNARQCSSLAAGKIILSPGRAPFATAFAFALSRWGGWCWRS